MAKHVVICLGQGSRSLLGPLLGIAFTALVVVGVWKVCMALGRGGMVAIGLIAFVLVGGLVLLLLAGARDHHREVLVQEKATRARQQAALAARPVLELEAGPAPLPANVIPFQRREREIA